MAVEAPLFAPRELALVILLVEDDDDTREILAEILAGLGATVIEAASGNQAFERFRAHRPDIILSDIRMDDGDGISLIRRVRALPGEEQLVPAISMSADASATAPLEAGFHAHLKKPFDPVQMLDLLRDFTAPAATARRSWMLTRTGPDKLTLALSGQVSGSDASVFAREVHDLVASAEHPFDIVVDFRGLDGFSPSAVSVAQRAVWPVRKRMRITFVGGPPLPRLLARAACAVLGIPAVFVEELS